MYAINGFDGDCAPHDGHIDLAFRDSGAWMEYDIGSEAQYSASQRIMVLLLGDSDAGPLLFFNWVSPTADEYPLFPAHAHDSDNWRLSLLGEMKMGKRVYRAGDFRFQNGGHPYPGDNVAWGPTGGMSIVMFADRRGFPVREVGKTSNAESEATMREVCEMAASFGVEILHPYPLGPAIRTSIGSVDNAGKIEGSFQSADRWPEILPGTRVAAGIFGEPNLGPILLFIQAAPYASAVPACSFGTEWLHVPIAGSCSIGGDSLEAGEFRIQEANASSGRIVAGENGLSSLIVIGDRRHRRPMDLEATEDGATWRQAIDGLIGELELQLANPAVVKS
jgi:hypothetical protein